MSWFIFALVCFLGWGLADLFYKLGADENDSSSHLKTAVWVGLVMGVVSLILIPFAETDFSFASLVSNAIKYSPASLSYIISMVIGYAGLRYLELSIISPVQNASGAFSAIAMVIFFMVTGHIENIFDEFTTLDIIGIIFTVAGVVILAIVERKISEKELSEGHDLVGGHHVDGASLDGDQVNPRKYKYGALALIFPLLYCLFDTIGTAADGIILDENAGLGLGEIDVIILYGLTFMAAGIIAWLYMYLKNKVVYNPFKASEKPKAIASVFEQFGQIFYVYAMAKNPVLAAPMIASYCICSVVLSRIFLKEKLTRNQTISVVLVIIGIVILGISEGLAEMV